MADLARIDTVFSSKHWRFIFTEPSRMPRTLREALERELPHISAQSWPARLAWGGAFINGKPYSSDIELPFPCKVEYYEPRFAIEEAEEFFPAYSADHVVYEDDDLIVAFKPAGLPSMPAKEQKRYSLKAYMERHTGSPVHLPSRLDMSTAGLAALSKTPRMHHPLQKLFERRRIEKCYLLQVSSPVCWSTLEVQARIGKSSEHPVLRAVVANGGQEAITAFRVVDESAAGVIVEARPKTGRTHQIRVHSAHAGWPIAGDGFYGGAPAPRLRLLSYRLRFLHPLTQAPLDIMLPERHRPDWLEARVLEKLRVESKRQPSI
jgi:RluA family pseudouridine synthase